MIAKVVFVCSWVGFIYLARSVAPPHRQKRHLIVQAGGQASDAREADVGLYEQNQHRSANHQEHTSGVVCPTWLNIDIQNRNLKPYLHCAGVNSAPFIAALYKSCQHDRSYVDANYTGSWDDHVPTANDLRVLSDLASWVREQSPGNHSVATVSWDQFSSNLGMNSPQVADLVQSVIVHPNSIPMDYPMRILDFGCGTGNDLASLQALFHTTSLNTICLDIVPVEKNGIYSMLLDGSSDFGYSMSLHAASVGLESTIHAVVSISTFHHISRPQMRHDALNFIKKVLRPGGLFLMSEWDDSLHPSRQIHYDLVHGVLPTLVFQGVAPSRFSGLEVDSRYLSINGWIDLVQSVNLTYDANRSKTHPGLLEPEAVANQVGNSIREFHIVFRK